MKLLSFFLSILLIKQTVSQSAYYVCATIKYAEPCLQMQRGSPSVKCVLVQDSIECAQRLINGTADFGVFTAENTLHLALLEWQNGVTVLTELRHKDKFMSTTDFQSVAIVRSDHQGGLGGLQGKNFCHPGLHYDKSQRWTERFLKHFERRVTELDCVPNKSPAEIEASTLKKFFGKVCRPGKWSIDKKENAELKKKYPALCELCDSTSNCSYTSIIHGSNINNHQQALNCLKNRGDVTYVSFDDAKHFFEQESESLADNYRYLCPNGTLETIQNNTRPCFWLEQPWGVVLGNKDKTVNLKELVYRWLNNPTEEPWIHNLKDIMLGDSLLPSAQTLTNQTPREHFRRFREIPIDTSICPKQINWCTTSPEEYEKCEVVRAGGLSTGVFPAILCNKPMNSFITCLTEVNTGNADFVSIDSNFGYLARKMYNLTSALYFETDQSKYASIVVVVHANSKFTTLKSLKDSRACLPIFGGTSTMAFINTGKDQGAFARDECRYGKLLHSFFGDSCVPGARDARLARSAADNSDSLCALCRSNIKPAHNYESQSSEPNGTNEQSTPVNCKPDRTNRYFGNRGALKCLRDTGDVAVLELQYLKDDVKELGYREIDFQIICRNGMLAEKPGFDVDKDCPLTTFVDGEVVVRRGSEKAAGVINVLTALDQYFQADPDFKMYNIFRGEKDLLFKDSTIGLIASNEDQFAPAVKNYINLFKNIEDCLQKNNAFALTINIFITFSMALLVINSGY